MSLIHDALRRDPTPEGERGSRAAHADSVLRALGYRPDRRASGRTKLVGLVLAFAGTVYIALSFNHGVDQAPGSVTARPRTAASGPLAGSAVSSSSHAESSGVSRVVAPQALAPQPHPTSLPVTSPAPTLARAPGPAAAAPTRRTTIVPEPTRHAQAGRSSESPPASRERLSSKAPAVVTTPSSVDLAATHVAPAGSLSGSSAAPPATAGPDDFQLALYYQRAGDFEQSLVHYQAVIGRDALNVEAHNNLGRLYLDKGLIDDAIREFQRVTAIDPGYARARTNLAAAYFKQGRYDLSAAEAHAALAIDPRNVDALVNLALAEKASGQVTDARESLLAALRIEPHHAAAHYNLARQCEDAGEIALALTHYEAFLKYAGPDLMSYAPEVRSRIAALSAEIK